MSAAQLLPASEIISRARALGVNFGKGNTAERLRYLVKLGLLPNAVKKTVVLDDLSKKLEGHFPIWTVDRLVQIEELLSSGLTLLEIKKKVEAGEIRLLDNTVSAAEKTTENKLVTKKANGFRTAFSTLIVLIAVMVSSVSAFENIKLAINPNKETQNQANNIKTNQSTKSLASTIFKTLENKDQDQSLQGVLADETLARYLELNTDTVINGSLVANNLFVGSSKENGAGIDQNGNISTTGNLNGTNSIFTGTTSLNILNVSGATDLASTLTLGSGNSTFHTGTGVPSNSLGNNGDYFFRTDGTNGSTSVYYKTGGAWVTTGGVSSLSSGSGISLSGSIGSITITNTGVTSLTAGNDISVSGSTGGVTVSDTSTLSSVTGRGATTSTALTLNGAITMGSTLSVTGTQTFTGATTFGSTTTLNGLTYTWPSTQTNGSVLTSDGSGTLTWTSPSGLLVTWDSIDDPVADQSLDMSTYTTDFNWTTGTGSDNLFNLTTDASANGTGSLLNIQTGTSSTVTPLRVRAGSTESIFVNTSGNVGIGTTDPSTGKLAVTGSAGTSTVYIAPVSGSSSGLTYSLEIGAISATGGGTKAAISLDNISGSASTNYGISTGSVTGGTTANYGINSPAITSTGATNSYGLNQQAISGTGTNNYGINIATLTSTGTINTAMNIAGLTGAGTTNTGLNIGTVSGATNNRGLVINTVPAGATNYAIYSSALAKSYLAGDLSVDGLITGIGGATITGTINLNATGTSSTAIGNSSGTITAISGGTSSWTNNSGNLTISTATSGTLAVSSAGALNLTGASASSLTIPADTASAFKIYDGTNNLLSFDTRTTTSGVSAITATGIAPTIASATGSEYTSLTVTPPTITLTGTTAVTSAMDSTLFNQPTITDSSAVTVSEANTLTVAGAPIPAGSATITRAVGLRVAAGAVASGATNAYGLFVDAPTSGSANYAAVFNSGNVGIGTTAPGSLLHVAGAARLGVASSTTGSLIFQNSSNTNTTTVQSGVAGGSITLTLPTDDGANGDCILSDGSGNLSFASCTGGAGGGVTSIDGQTGVVAVSNATGSGGTITIDNAAADGSTKGIAAFNSTNFSASSGVINTIQGISSAASPTFTGLTLSGLSSAAGSGVCISGGVLSTCATGSSAGTLQSSYDNGATIATTTAKDIAFTLSSGLATPTQFSLTQSHVSGTNALYVNNANASGTNTNGVLVEQTGAGTLTNGINVTQTAGTLTNGLTFSGTFTKLINSTNFNVTNAGVVTAVGVNSGSGLIQGTGGETVTGTTNINATGTALTNIGNSTGVLTLASGGNSGWTNTSGTLTISTASSGAINLTSAHTAGQTTDSAFNITTSTDLGSSDEFLQFGDSGATFMTILGNGSVGIGDTSPSSQLEVGNGTDSLQVSSVGDLTFVDADGAASITGPAGGALSVTAGTAQALNLDSGTTGAVNIGTGSNAKTITVGNATGATGLTLTTGTAGIAATSTTVSGTGFALTTSSLTTGTAQSITANALTTGTVLQLTATAITSGSFFDINNGSSIFNVSNTSFTTSLPTNFTGSGDVGIANDLQFTNPTASYIKSTSQLNIVAGETFNSSNLTLQTYNQGSIVLQTATTTGTGVDGQFNSLTTGKGTSLASSSITTGTLLDLSVTEATLNGGYYLRAYDQTAAAAVFTVGEDGITTIAGLEGSNSLILTAGDAAISDGSLSITDDDNAATLALVNNTATTIGVGAAGGVATLGSTSLTTGTLLDLQLTEGTLNGGFYLRAWDNTGSSAVFTIAEDGVTALGSYLQVGGMTATTYSRFGTGTTGHSLSGAGSVLISGDLEVDGTTYFDGGLTIAGNILPATNDTYTLGDDDQRWADVFVGPATVHVGTSTTDEGAISYNTTSNIFNFGTDSTTNADIAFFTDDLYLDKSAGSVGINDTSPDAFLEVLGTTEQLRLTYTDGTVDSRFTVDSSGDLTINNTGTQTIISDDLAVNGGDLTTSQTTATLFNTTATTLSLGGAATTLNINNGTADSAINIASGAGNHTINIAGTGATLADTINIGTGGTGADIITIGNNASSTSLALTSGTGDVAISSTDLITLFPTTATRIGNATDYASLSADGDITFVDADGAASITGPAGGALNITSNSSQAVTIDSGTTGAVNIGTGTGGSKVINIGNAVAGSYITFGSGNETGSTTTSSFAFDAAEVKSGTGLYLVADEITTGRLTDIATSGNTWTGNGTTNGLFNLASTSTGGTGSSSSILMNLSRSGTNDNTAHTAYGLYSAVTNTNVTSGTNVAGYFSASGATTANYGIYSAAGTNYFAGAVAANGGITFDATTDTIGAHTAAGTYDMNTNLITNIGNASTDFTSGGGLTLAGTFDANGQFDIGDGGDAGTISSTTLDIDATGALQINSSGGAISIGNDAVAQAINIGTGAAARTITMGNATGATALAFNSGTGSQTFTSKVATGTTTTSAFVFDAGDLTTGTGSYLTSDSITTGTLASIATTGNTFTSGTLLSIASTSTAITSGKFLDISNGSSIFSISNTDFTTSLPANFTAAGDSSFAYDISMTNPTASYIKSAAPLTIQAGETFNSSNLNLTTYNFGSVVIDSIVTTSASAATKYNLYINAGDSTSTADTVYGAYILNALTGNAAKTGYGAYALTSSTSTTADTIAGGGFYADANGAISSGTKNVYGLLGGANSDTPTDTGGTIGTYGGYFYAVAAAGGTSTAYGVYGYASGADSNYPFYAGTAFPSANTAALCWDNSGESAIYDCSGSVSADYMEMYPTEGNLELGDIVMTSNNYATTTQGDKVAKLKKTTTDYQSGVIGIVSDRALAGDFNSIGYNIEETDNPQPVALNGRVLVKVSANSPAIAPGDYITTSNDQGKAMKANRAGQMIGKALESWEPNSGKDKVMVYVTNIYADPNNLLANLTVDSDGSLVIPKAQISNLTIDGSLTIKNSDGSVSSFDSSALTLVGTLATTVSDVESTVALQDLRINNLETQTATASAELANTKSALEELRSNLASNSASIAQINTDISELDLTPADYLFSATASATLASINVTDRVSTLNLQSSAFETVDATVSGTLKALGDTFLGKTTIAGDLTVDGTFSVTSGNSLNALTTLYIQNNPLSELVDFFNGLVTVNKNGQVALEGVKLGTKSLGTGTILAGQLEAIIETTAIEANSKIFITPVSDIDGALIVPTQVEGVGFIVKTTKANTADIQFNWLIIQSKEASN